MRHPLLASAFVVGVALAPAVYAEAPPEPAMSPALTKALEGRVRGPARSCINLRDVQSTQIIDREAIIYKASGRRWFVNIPDRGQCTALRQSSTLVTRTSTSQLCSADIVRLVDTPGRFEYGSCGLGQFIEYTRAPR